MARTAQTGIGASKRIAWGARLAPAVGAAAIMLTFGLALACPAAATDAIITSSKPLTLARDQPPLSKPVSTQLNQTGRTLTLPMPLKDGEKRLGDVSVRIGVDDSIEVAIADLVERTRSTLDQTTRTRIEALNQAGADRREATRYARLATIAAAGMPITFDPGLQELQIAPAVDQRKTGDISIAPPYAPTLSTAAARPAIWSGYVNVTAGVDYDWGASAGEGARGRESGGRLDLESVVRAYDIVFENRALIDGVVDTFVCPVQATCNYAHESGYKRDSSRLVYDVPSSHLRFQAGDTTAIGLPLQRSTETLGLSIEKSARKLAPGDARYASARTSLRIERTSDVDVIVNGVSLQRLTLRPGTYNVRDLPLATGANTVELAITDETGARRVQTFTTFAGADMLEPGAFEWAASAGLQSYLRDNQRRYEDSDGAIATGLARYGLSDIATGEAHLQGDRNGAMGGVGLITETPWGVFTLGGAISFGTVSQVGLTGGVATAGDSRAGFAADVSYDLVNYRGFLSSTSESFRLAAEYRSPEFFRPGQIASLVSGVFYPEYNYWLRLSASYSLALDWSTSVSLSGRYQFSDEEVARLTPFALAGDRYGADISVSRPISPTVTGSLLVGYSNESFLRYAFDDDRDRGGDFRAAVRFHIRPDDRSTITASYDSLDGLAGVSGYRAGGDGVGRWDATVDVQNFETTERTAASGSVSYTGNRAEVRVSHHSDLSGRETGQSQSRNGVSFQQQRSTLRVGSAIAFADGVVAVGPPVRGEAFAIVHPHESLASKTIAAGGFETPRAYADTYGPGLVGDLPAFSPSTIPVDVADLPIGYSLGAAAFDLRAPYKSGYALEVGSGRSVSVYGTLLNGDGTPVELASGFVMSAAGGTERIAVFTNAKGRFGAEGLSPGRWLIEVEGDQGPARYAIEVPDGADGLVRAGELRPLAGGKS